MFSDTMPSHTKKEPPATYLILEASVAAALANLEAVGIIMGRDVDDDAED
jgi:hypothetical protein